MKLLIRAYFVVSRTKENKMKYSIMFFFFLVLLTFALTSKEKPKELTDREVWEIQGKWRLDMARMNQEDSKDIKIEVIDHDVLHWREALKIQD